MSQRDPITGKFPPRPGKASAGDGWGGPKQGASSSRIKPGDPDGIQRMRHDPDILRRNAERVRTLKDHLFHLATNADRQETQLAAVIAFLNREEGTPINRSVIANVGDPNNLTDAELAAIAAGGRAAPDPAPGDPAEPGGVVH